MDPSVGGGCFPDRNGDALGLEDLFAEMTEEGLKLQKCPMVIKRVLMRIMGYKYISLNLN